MSKMTLSEELLWRGFANQTTYKDFSIIDGSTIKFYFGVDPSSDSMTIGNLASAMMSKHFINYGHQAYLLVGGATGMIGDPDGKATERNLLTLDQIEINKKSIAKQYEAVFSGQTFKVVDNYDWFQGINYLDFLRNVGKHVPMRQMLGREFVQSRLSENGAGISYAEFSYSLIQGYDFVHLNKEFNVSLQLCGADQWGNSIAGVDLIRRLNSKEAHVWSAPLIINRATGKKFGKTEDGAVWLDENKTSVYKFYQFWINLDDEGVEEYIKIFTMIKKTELDELMQEHNEDRSKRLAQNYLAYEVTKIVHGEKRAESIKKLSETLFGGSDYLMLTSEEFSELKSELKTTKAKEDSDIVQVLVDCELASSKGEARRFMVGNAIYINGKQISSEKTNFQSDDFVDGFAVIRRGKNANALVELA
jgi:tyrosyl-tRNA synthetase